MCAQEKVSSLRLCVCVCASEQVCERMCVAVKSKGLRKPPSGVKETQLDR